MLKALKTLLKDDIINQNTWRIKCMGTQQALTTEQLELLIIIDEIETFDRVHPDNIPAGGIKEILNNNGIMSPEDFSRIANVLGYYGYIHNGDELTVDGKQYIELFKEYLKQKSENPNIEHISYSLLNFEKLEINLEACLSKISVLENLGEIPDLLKNVVQVVKEFIHK